MRQYFKKFAITLLVLGLHGLSAQQGSLNIMSYNLLNYPDHDDQYVRTDNFVTILSAIEPDILVVTEMKSQEGVDRLLDYGLSRISRDYTAGPFINGRDTDNAAYYRSDRVTLENNIRITTALRDINGYTFSINDHDDATFAFTIFMAHLKASQGTENAKKRHTETLKLAGYIATQDSNYCYAFAGDFNFYGASEPGYKLLLDSLAVDLEDPIDAPGEWNKNSSYSYLHTQSTRTTQFDGGASGGLDDRFDFILLSHQMLRESGPLTYVTGTYKAYGNDGNQFDGNINSGNNRSVSRSLADALYYASDHLPVLLELSYPTVLAVADRQTPTGYELLRAFPNPFNPAVTLTFELSAATFATLTIHDLTGRELSKLVKDRLLAGDHQVIWDAKDSFGRPLPAGIYLARLATPGYTKSIKMVLLK